MPFLFGRKRKDPDRFISPPLLDVRKLQVYDLYNLVYCNAIPVESFEKANMISPGKALGIYAANYLKHSCYELNCVPAVRRYYGEEFIHGITLKYDESVNEVCFVNLDDNEQTLEFTRELTRIVSIAFRNLLDKYDLYVYYMGESFKFISGQEYKKISKKIKMENRIVWVE